MSVSDAIPERAPIRLGLLLVEGFSLMSYASIVEPFRAANVLAGQEFYAWNHIAVSGSQVSASNHMTIKADCDMASAPECSRIFVFAAGDPASFKDRTCFAWLRARARRGTHLAGVSGGPYLLARAGLLEGYRTTIHWEHAPALAQEFPELELEPSLFVIDGARMTCAGGTAGMDLAISLIERDHGPALAARVGEWFIRTQPRTGTASQRPSLKERFGTVNMRLLRMLAAMEGALEEPLSRTRLAQIAGISLRQLERLCLAELGQTISATYLDIRLTRAEHLLRSTGLSVTQIALACGFRSASHFSRSYKQHTGSSPSAVREQG